MNRKWLSLALAAALGCTALPLTAAAQDYYRGQQTADYDRDGHRDGGRRGTSDSAIQYRVQRALSRDLGYAANDINVRVEDRNVYLSGRVDRPGQRQRARNVADNVDGVRTVYADRLRVRRY
jgi:osmotically-inducible protein OsmY